jgi:mannitol-1-/sugar-/sorbitol-6-/2-deoxyglucose-6-phosphatase
MLNSVLFDMDGLLIDSEPLWQEAGMETLREFGIELTLAQYHQTTGLRTVEWIDHWFSYFHIQADQEQAVKVIVDKAVDKIGKRGEALPGVIEIMELFQLHGFKIGIATSSPMQLVDVVVEKLQIGQYLQALVSAENLPQGKPHPQVYLNGASALQSKPQECLCFEDSFHGMIAAKAARMTCIVVPAKQHLEEKKWHAADQILSSLLDFNAATLKQLQSV